MDDMSWVDDDEFWRKIYEEAEAKKYVFKKKDNSMRIEGLTRRQAALCKVIWSCESAEEIAKFIVTLPESDQKICDGLLQLLNYEYLEQDAKLEHYEEFPDVEDILKEIREKDANGYYNNVSRSAKDGKIKTRGKSRRTQISTPSVKRKNRPPRKKPEPPCEA
jgi:hypothetical protein